MFMIVFLHRIQAFERIGIVWRNQVDIVKPGKFDDFPWTTSQGEKAYFFVGSGIRTIYHYIYMLIYVYINIYILVYII